jgi:hypothetical protein
MGDRREPERPVHAVRDGPVGDIARPPPRPVGVVVEEAVHGVAVHAGPVVDTV